MAVSVAGLFAGVLGALVLTRFMRSLLYQVEPADPLTFVSIQSCSDWLRSPRRIYRPVVLHKSTPF